MISINAEPGVVSAIFFVVFDVFTLGVIDVVLSKVVCSLYYTRINRGFPISVVSIDVLGVTTYLLGRFFSLINVIALLLKMAFIVIVFAINLNIQSKGWFSLTPQVRDATFDFRVSNDFWDNELLTRLVARRLSVQRRCRVETERTVNFYPLYFDLTNGTFLANDIGEPGNTTRFIPNDTTLICATPDRVLNPTPMAEIVGCTDSIRNENANCLNSTPVKMSAQLPRTQESAPTFEITRGQGKIVIIKRIYYGPALNGAFARFGFADTTNATCADHIIQRELFESNQVPKLYSNCFVQSTNGSHTAVDRWSIQPGENGAEWFVRDYPGPLFKGNIIFGDIMIVASLQYTIQRGMDFRAQAAVIVSDGSVYRGLEDGFRFESKRRETLTVIPTYAIVLAALSLVMAVSARLFVQLTIGKDQRPKFNTIDGLSSIVREENNPSGRSLATGESAVVGLSQIDARTMRFGPLNDFNHGKARDPDSILE